MALIREVATAEARTLDVLAPGWRELVQRLLWEAVDALEQADPERELWTFRFKVWRLPASFTFRVKHLRAVVGVVLGAHP